MLAFNELQTVVFEVASLLNQRPVGVKSINDVEIRHLCLNDLLIGRSSASVLYGSVKFNDNVSPKTRCEFTQRIIDNF